MDRQTYLLVTGVLVVLVASLLGIPLWDLWYYRALRSSPGSYIPVAVVVAAPPGAGSKRPGPPPATWTAGFLEASRPMDAPIPHPEPEQTDPTRVIPSPLMTEAPAHQQELAAMGQRHDSTDLQSASSVEHDRVDLSPTQVAGIETPGIAVWYPPQPEHVPAEDPAHLPPKDASPRGSEPSSRIMPSPATPGDADPSPRPLPAVRLVPDRNDLLPGEAVVVTVQVSDAVSMSSLPFHLRFDPEVLEFVDSQAGAALSESYEPVLLASVSPNRPGDLAVGLSLVDSSGLFSGSGALVQLRFRAVASGESDLDFDRASLRGPTSRPLNALFEKTRIRVQ